MRVRAPSASRARIAAQIPEPSPIGTYKSSSSGYGAKQLEHARRHAAHERLGETTARSAGRARPRAPARARAPPGNRAPCSIKVAPSARIAAFLSTAVAVRHDDRRRQTEAARRERHALAVVAARRRDHAAHTRLARAQLAEVHQPAARLERAGRQVVLVLDPDLARRRGARAAARRSAASAAASRGRTPRRPRARQQAPAFTSSPAPRTCRPAARAGRPRTSVVEPDAHPREQVVGGELARAETQHVRVVVLARHLGRARVVDERAAHAGDAVRGHRHADAVRAGQDRAVGLALARPRARPGSRSPGSRTTPSSRCRSR